MATLVREYHDIKNGALLEIGETDEFITADADGIICAVKNYESKSVNTPERGSFRFDVCILEDRVVVTISKDGFFFSNGKKLNLALFERFYDTDSCVAITSKNIITLIMQRKEEFSDYRSVAKIFERSTKSIVPKIKKGKFKVLRFKSENGIFLLTYVNTERKRFIRAKPIALNDAAYYLSVNNLRFLRKGYASSKGFSVVGYGRHIYKLSEQLFPEGFDIFRDEETGDYIIANETTCDFCGATAQSHLEDIVVQELCPECAKHKETLKAYANSAVSIVPTKKAIIKRKK